MAGIETHDGICRYLCVSTGTVVISVEYRLVPEARFPAIPEDCYAAFV
jgi:acetyl esterase